MPQPPAPNARKKRNRQLIIVAAAAGFLLILYLRGRAQSQQQNATGGISQQDAQNAQDQAAQIAAQEAAIQSGQLYGGAGAPGSPGSGYTGPSITFNPQIGGGTTGSAGKGASKSQLALLRKDTAAIAREEKMIKHLEKQITGLQKTGHKHNKGHNPKPKK